MARVTYLLLPQIDFDVDGVIQLLWHRDPGGLDRGLAVGWIADSARHPKAEGRGMKDETNYVGAKHSQPKPRSYGQNHANRKPHSFGDVSESFAQNQASYPGRSFLC